MSDKASCSVSVDLCWALPIYRKQRNGHITKTCTKSKCYGQELMLDKFTISAFNRHDA